MHDPKIADVFKGKTILIVDDDVVDLEIMARVLREDGRQVLIATSGEEGLTTFAKQGGKIDLIVADVVMPGMNGTEFVRNVIRFSPLQRVLFISGQWPWFGLPDYPQSDHVEKSADMMRLRTKVREALDGRGSLMDVIHIESTPLYSSTTRCA